MLCERVGGERRARRKVLTEGIFNHVELVGDLQQCEAALATSSLAALQTRGVALVRLTMLSRRTGLYGRTIITFICNRGGVRAPLPATKLSTGDIVGVVIPDAGPLKPRSTGVITECGSSSVAVAFEPIESASTEEDDDFPDGQITLVSMTNDVTYRRLTRFEPYLY